MTNGNTPCISGGYANMMTEEDSDLIRRSDALDCFHDWIDKYGDVHTPDEMAEYRAIEELPSVEQEKHTEKRTETHACDLISRQAAIDLVRDVCNAVMSGCESWYDPETEDEVYKDIREVDDILKCNKEVRIALRNMPSAQQDCTECEEYDQTTHSCPRYCDVIRKTLEEAKQERTGRWIEYDNSHCECPFCHVEWSYFDNEVECFNYCPNCGARLEGEG